MKRRRKPRVDIFFTVQILSTGSPFHTGIDPLCNADSTRLRIVNLIRAFHLINPNYAWRRDIAALSYSFLSLSFSLPRARPPECTFNPRIPAALADKLMTDAGYWPVKSINSSGLTRRAILSRNHIAKTLENLMLLVNRSLQVTSQRILSCTSKSLDVLILQQRYIFKQYWKNISRCFLKFLFFFPFLRLTKNNNFYLFLLF